MPHYPENCFDRNTLTSTSSVLDSAVFRIRIHWFWIRIWIQIHLFYRIRIWVWTVAESGSNPDPDHGFYDKTVLTCTIKNFCDPKCSNVFLNHQKERSGSRRIIQLQRALKTWNLFLFPFFGVRSYKPWFTVCPTLLCWHRVILCIDISYLITGLHPFHRIVHLNNKVIWYSVCVS